MTSRGSLCLTNSAPFIQIVPAIKPPIQIDNSTKKYTPPLRKAKFPGAGILLGILSSFCFSVAIFLVKASKSAEPVQFVVCRGYFQLFMMLAIAIYQGKPDTNYFNRTTALWLGLSGLFGAIQQVSTYYAVTLISLADGTAVLLSAPVFVSIFACVLLKEKCGLMQVVTVLLALIGVLLVCRPTFLFGEPENVLDTKSSGDRILGFILVGFGCILMAAIYITLRKASHVPYPVTNAVLAGFSIVIGVPYMFITGQGLRLAQCGMESAFVVTSAVMGTLGMLLFVLATQIEFAGPLSVARSSEIVFAFCWQMALLGDIPSWTSLAGAAAIVSSVALLGFERWKEQNPKAYNRCLPSCRFPFIRSRISGDKTKKGNEIQENEMFNIQDIN